MTQERLVLASGSPYRRALLDRLGLSFICDAPGIDEARKEHEPPVDYVARLAREKAQAVAHRHPQGLIIGSDQAAVRDETLLGKPGTLERARAQLLAASGRRVTFLTGLCLLDAASGECQLDVVPYAVMFRELDELTVERYLAREPALDAAGSFHAEGLGVSLFTAMEGEDPTALIGLPLIRLTDFLRRAGITVP